jgi:hypothetical protein
MPGNEPTTNPVEFEHFDAWIAWRMQQPNPPATIGAALDEVQALAANGIIELVTEATLGLFAGPGQKGEEIVPPEEIIRYRPLLVPPERFLAAPGVILTPSLLGPAPYLFADLFDPPKDRKLLGLRLADTARFWKYIEGALVGLTPPAPVPDKPQRVSKEQLLAWLLENYQTRPIAEEFIAGAKRHFKHPWFDVKRQAARDALVDPKAIAALGPITRRLRRRPLG